MVNPLKYPEDKPSIEKPDIKEKPFHGLNCTVCYIGSIQ